MKALIWTSLFFVLFLNVTAQWTQVFTNNTSNDLIQALQATPDGGVIAVRDADYIKSNDFGINWTIYSSSSMGCASSYLRSLSMHNKDTFCITSNVGGNLYVRNNTTLNNGSTFNCYTYTVLQNLYVKQTTQLNKNGTIYMAVDDGFLYRSSNFGGSFTIVEDVDELNFISFNSDSAGILFQDFDMFYYNHSSGILTNLNTPGLVQGGAFGQGQFIGDSTIYVITGAPGNRSNLYKTTNLGQTWTKIFNGYIGGNNYFSKIHFINQDTGFVYGNNILLRTLNGGITWQVQRFNTLLVDKIFFTNVNNGFIGGRINSVSYIYKTTNGGGTWADFNYYYINYPTCCSGVPCNINYGSNPSNSYMWVLDGNLVSTSQNPPPQAMSSGNHTLLLITSNGIEVDTFSMDVYSAPPLTPPLDFDLFYDSTLCYNTYVSVSVNNAIVDNYYSFWKDSVRVTGPVQANISQVYVYTPNLTASDTLILMMETEYPHCPNNTYSEEVRFYVYPNPAEDPPYFLEDSVCRGDTAVMVIPFADDDYDYTAGTLACCFWEQINGSDQPYYVEIPINPLNGSTANYLYRVEDIYNCINFSDSIRLFVDSVSAHLYSQAAYGFPGDTIVFNNNSEGTSMSWEYDTSYLSMSSSNWNTTSFVLLNDGRTRINLEVSNNTGCVDSVDRFVDIFNQNFGTNNYCSDHLTNDLPSTLYGEIGCKSFQNYSKVLHVDKSGNQYIAGFSAIESNLEYGNSFITKIYPAGIIQWRKDFYLIGATTIDEVLFVSSIDTDSLENVYLTGRYNSGNFSVDGISAPNNNLNEPGAGFIMKISPAGIAQWIDVFNYGLANEASMAFNIKVMNNHSIWVGVNNVKSVIKMPLGQNIWTNTQINDNGFLVLDENGNIQKLVECEGVYENFQTNVNGCSTHAAGDIPYGVDFEIVGNRIYCLSMHEYLYGIQFSTYYPHTVYSPSGQPEAIIMVMIYDTTGNLIRDFEVARYTHNVSLMGNYDWINNGIRSSEPKIEVDSKSNIYVSLSPQASQNYTLGSEMDSVDISNCGFVIPGEGFIPGSHRTNMITKFDSSGTVLYRLYNNGIVFKDFCLSANRQLNCIADFTKYYTLGSAFGSWSGDINYQISDWQYVSRGLYFSYDEFGNLITANPIVTNGIVTTAGISAIDTCNSNVFFAFASNDDANYVGNIFNVYTNNYIVNVNDNSFCNDQSICPWLPGQSTVSQDEIEMKMAGWYLMPNPASENITLIGDKQLKGEITVYNSIGQNVFFDETKNLNGYSFTISEFSKGIYHILMTDENGIVTGKLSFIKQ